MENRHLRTGTHVKYSHFCGGITIEEESGPILVAQGDCVQLGLRCYALRSKSSVQLGALKANMSPTHSSGTGPAVVLLIHPRFSTSTKSHSLSVVYRVFHRQLFVEEYCAVYEFHSFLSVSSLLLFLVRLHSPVGFPLYSASFPLIMQYLQLQTQTRSTVRAVGRSHQFNLLITDEWRHWVFEWL